MRHESRFHFDVQIPPATQSATRLHSNRSHDAVIRVYDAAGNVIGTETQEHAHALRVASAVVSPGLVKALWPLPGLESSRGPEGPLYPADWLYLVL